MPRPTSLRPAVMGRYADRRPVEALTYVRTYSVDPTARKGPQQRVNNKIWSRQTAGLTMGPVARTHQPHARNAEAAPMRRDHPSRHHRIRYQSWPLSLESEEDGVTGDRSIKLSYSDIVSSDPLFRGSLISRSLFFPLLLNAFTEAIFYNILPLHWASLVAIYLISALSSIRFPRLQHLYSDQASLPA